MHAGGFDWLDFLVGNSPRLVGHRAPRRINVVHHLRGFELLRLLGERLLDNLVRLLQVLRERPTNVPDRQAYERERAKRTAEGKREATKKGGP